SECSKDQPQTTERLEGCKIRVLDGQIRLEALRGRRDGETVTRERCFQRAPHIAGALSRNLNEEGTVAFLARIELQGIRLGKKQLALEETVLQQSGHMQTHLLAAAIERGEFLAKPAVQDPLHCVGFAEDGNRSVVAWFFEQQPGIVAFLTCAGLGFLEVEAVPLYQ